MSVESPRSTRSPATSRPSSAYEDLSLEDDGPAATDPWRSSSTTHSSTFSTQTVFSSSTPGASSSRPAYSSTPSVTSTSQLSNNRRGPLPMVLGVAVVDFNHLIGPTVEFAYPASLQNAIQDDEALGRLLPFLALPDGAHLSEEDYSYFHCTYTPSDPTSLIDTEVPSDQTLFGISCNRQLASAELLRRPSDVTRSTVQKAVVVIASQPVFGPIRDRLGVVTRAYFAQRDFSQTDLLEAFYASLEDSLEGKSGESAIYIGTSLRELVHKFRHRTLVLLKMLMLQKRVMLYGYPVEMLCTYQYSLVSLIPGLLMSLKDSGSPELDSRGKRVRPTSLRSSDRSSLLRYMGLPLHLFGKDAVFQPYMPLQQMDMLQARSWLVGTTNQIVTQQKDCKYDLLVNIENVSFEFPDAKLERLVALTPADRKWMDDVVRTVEESYELPDGERPGFRGSDDYLRNSFEEYICAALASLKYADFLSKGKAGDISILGVAGESNVLSPFSEAWLGAFRQTEAYAEWQGCTDPVLFDICEPRHPCDGKATLVSDFGLRITEGLHELKIDQQLAPTREALTSAFATGSASLFKAFDAARNEVSSRLKEREETDRTRKGTQPTQSQTNGTAAAAASPDIRATLGGIGSSVGSFFGSRVASFRGKAEDPTLKGLRPMSLSPSASSASLKPWAGGTKRESG
ncbi:transport protein Avl9-domain-containing protein [Naematelia encephala]|uniref:Transport protein Avl9-domain-containing protein n=1 Tax=Naematelia encephala TaxID=71784 RepID=A0A1Y2B9Y8_9TREE|nr:transport protein Avl9-domain-containing protein [Naematelia encephala]